MSYQKPYIHVTHIVSMENQKLLEKLKEIDNIVSQLTEPTVKEETSKKLIAELFGENKLSAQKSNRNVVLGESALKKTKRGITKSVGGKKFALIQEDIAKDKEMRGSIDRTENPEIHKMKNNLDKILLVLKVMEGKGHDWLNASQIHSILYDVFKIPINRPAISMTLIRDKLYTRRKDQTYKGTNVNIFSLSQNGEEYIGERLNEIKHNQQKFEDDLISKSGD